MLVHGALAVYIILFLGYQARITVLLTMGHQEYGSLSCLGKRALFLNQAVKQSEDSNFIVIPGNIFSFLGMYITLNA